MNIQNKLVVLTITLIGALSMAGCGKTEDKGPKPEAAPEVKTETAPEPKTTVGTDVDDNVITTKVKSALLADEEVKGLDVKVETHKGEVQLSGYVDTQAQIDRAITVTRGVEGVKNVDNKMMLKTTDTTVGEKIDDGIITTKVKAALLGDSGVDGTDVAVVTRDGEVQLSGYVTDAAQIDRAAEVARGVKGVKNVVNELSVKK
ncbi:BON domain-containing protein [Nitrosovibrio sp. Nv4]|uniref:BON domain-containing protein n=1 Tax=Nitrosovibrio sp. Nv4 TaxID=1945880 RepID=UPI000BCF8990|nr:BON domain-containing protein [Nitrosovibrio sp. Nv4]SOD41439.1 hyperosmotically inducible protein [Nitrosovibrio sp. Nv4]